MTAKEYIGQISRLESHINAKKQRIEAMRTFSKEVEYSAENMDTVFSKIKKSRHFGSDNIINILSSKFAPHKEK